MGSWRSKSPKHIWTVLTTSPAATDPNPITEMLTWWIHVRSPVQLSLWKGVFDCTSTELTFKHQEYLKQFTTALGNQHILQKQKREYEKKYILQARSFLLVSTIVVVLTSYVTLSVLEEMGDVYTSSPSANSKTPRQTVTPYERAATCADMSDESSPSPSVTHLCARLWPGDGAGAGGHCHWERRTWRCSTGP